MPSPAQLLLQIHNIHDMTRKVINQIIATQLKAQNCITKLDGELRLEGCDISNKQPPLDSN